MSTARTVSFKTLVNLAEKGRKEDKEPAYEFSKRNFQKNRQAWQACEDVSMTDEFMPQEYQGSS